MSPTPEAAPPTPAPAAPAAAAEWSLPDGTRLRLRPVRPEDAAALQKFHRGLSSRSVYNRYFTALPLEARIAPARLAQRCRAVPGRDIVRVIERAEPLEAPGLELVGIGRLARAPGADSAEFALLIGDRWQGRGLGRRLLTELIAAGRAEGLARITGDILSDNAALKAICLKLGFKLRMGEDSDCCQSELVLRPPT